MLLLCALFAYRLGALPMIGMTALVSTARLQIYLSQRALIDGYFAFWAIAALWLAWENLQRPRHLGLARRLHDLPNDIGADEGKCRVCRLCHLRSVPAEPVFACGSSHSSSSIGHNYRPGDRDPASGVVGWRCLGMGAIQPHVCRQIAREFLFDLGSGLTLVSLRGRFRIV